MPVDVEQGVVWKLDLDGGLFKNGTGPTSFFYTGAPLSQGMHEMTGTIWYNGSPTPFTFYATGTDRWDFGIDDDGPNISCKSQPWSYDAASGHYQLNVDIDAVDNGVAGVDPSTFSGSVADSTGLVNQSLNSTSCGTDGQGNSQLDFNCAATYSTPPKDVTLNLSVSDWAGNVTNEQVTIEGPPQIKLTPPTSVFSPNGDGTKDTDSLTVTSTADWTLSVDGQGTIQKGAATGDAGTTISWDGTVNGAKLKDGSYTVRLHADGAPDQTANVTIDTQAPQITGATLQAGSIDSIGAVTIEGTASIADLGLAGVDPSSIKAALGGADVTSFTYTLTADGSSINYQGKVLPPKLEAGLTGNPHAYRVESADPINATTVAINILASDKAGNEIGRQFVYQINFPPSANRGGVRSDNARLAEDPEYLEFDLEMSQYYKLRYEEEFPAPPPPRRLPKGPIVPESLNKVTKEYLKELGIDAHALKRQVLGKNAPIAQYNIYKDASGELWLYPTRGQSPGIETGVNIADPSTYPSRY